MAVIHLRFQNGAAFLHQEKITYQFVVRIIYVVQICIIHRHGPIVRIVGNAAEIKNRGLVHAPLFIKGSAVLLHQYLSGILNGYHVQLVRIIGQVLLTLRSFLFCRNSKSRSSNRRLISSNILVVRKNAKERAPFV